MFKKKQKTAAQKGQDWRCIEQRPKGRGSLSLDKLRRSKRFYAALALFCLLIWTCVTQEPARNAPSSAQASSHGLQITLETNGILNLAWIEKTLQIPKERALNALDLFELKAKLEPYSQIQSIELEKQFPNTLQVRLKEHIPAMRLQSPEKQGRSKLLVSEAGTPFLGIGYKAPKIHRLPLLSGLETISQDQTHYRFAHSPRPLTHLLACIKKEYPKLYQSLERIHCRYFDTQAFADHALVHLHTRDGQELCFASENIPHQVQRLKQIHLHCSRNHQAFPRKIDLSSKTQAVASF